MKWLRKLALSGAYLLAVLTLAFVVLEVAATIVMANRLAKTAAMYEGILKGSGNVLDLKKNHAASWDTEEFKVAIRTNRRGFREDFDFEDKDIDVAFLGDSFVFGHGVEAADRFTSVVARKHPELVVAALSYSNGFQPEHYEYFLDRHPELRPKVAFVTVYLGNDLDSDLNETRVTRDADGRIVELELPNREIYRGNLVNKRSYKHEWFAGLVRRTELGKFIAYKINTTPEWRQEFWNPKMALPNTPNRLSTERGELDAHNQRAVRALKRIGEIIQGRGGELQVLVVPQNYLVGKVRNPHLAPVNKGHMDELRARNGLVKAMLARCREEGLICHDLSSVLTPDDYYQIDAHWNVKGHEKAGRFASAVLGNWLARRQ